MPETPTPRDPLGTRPNANTLLPSAWTPPALDHIEAGLTLALRTLREAAAPPDVPGVHVFAVRDGRIEGRFLRAGAEEYLVIGRHERCDLRLAADPAISLRHLVARVVTLRDGSAALRLLDLSTRCPLVLSDGTLQRSLVGTGPFAVGVGSYVIGGVPHDLDRYVRGPAPTGTRPGGPYRTAPPVVERASSVPDHALESPAGQRRSRITLMPSSRMVTSLSGLAVDACAQVTLSRASGGSGAVVLDRESLELGVLVGRAERCLDGLRALMTMSISRVHLMLLADGDRTFALDVASTQGTYERGRMRRAVELTGRTCALSLGQYDAVQLVWRALG